MLCYRLNEINFLSNFKRILLFENNLVNIYEKHLSFELLCAFFGIITLIYDIGLLKLAFRNFLKRQLSQFY